MIAIIICVIGSCIYLKINDKQEIAHNLLPMLCLTIGFGAIGLIMPAAARLSLFFTMLQMVIWSWIFKFSKQHTWLYVIIISQIVIMAKEITDFFYDPVWHYHFIEYHTIFEAPYWM